MIKPKKMELKRAEMKTMDSLPEVYTEKKYVGYDEDLDLKNIKTDVNLDFLEQKIKKMKHGRY